MTRQLKFRDSRRGELRKATIECKAARLQKVAAAAAAVGRDLPASSPAGAPPAAAEGDDELDMAATASSLLPASLDTVIVLVAERQLVRAAGRLLCEWNTRAVVVSSERERERE